MPEDSAFLAALLTLSCSKRFPLGTSKWNKIEHRLFSRITLNWPAPGHSASRSAKRTWTRCRKCGGRGRKAKGSHGRPLFDSTHRVLITIIHLRQVCSQKVLCELPATNPVTIGQAVRQTRLLLDEQQVAVAPAMLHFSRVADLVAYLDTDSTGQQTRLPENHIRAVQGLRRLVAAHRPH